jgi:predicted protein tyrosine phosphatase
MFGKFKNGQLKKRRAKPLEHKDKVAWAEILLCIRVVHGQNLTERQYPYSGF